MTSKPPSPDDVAPLPRTSIGAVVVPTALSSFQVGVGIVAHSEALLADGLMTLTGVIGGLIAPSGRFSPADPRERALIVLVAALMMGAAAGLIVHALFFLQHAYLLSSLSPYALVAAALAVIVKEALHRREGEAEMQADALRPVWLRHNASSLLVVIGLAANLAGFTILDGVAAILVALLLARRGWRMARGLLANAHGTPIDRTRATGVAAEDQHLFDEVRALLPPGWQIDPQSAIRRDGERVTLDLLLEGAGDVAAGLEDFDLRLARWRETRADLSDVRVFTRHAPH